MIDIALRTVLPRIRQSRIHIQLTIYLLRLQLVLRSCNNIQNHCATGRGSRSEYGIPSVLDQETVYPPKERYYMATARPHT